MQVGTPGGLRLVDSIKSTNLGAFVGGNGAWTPIFTGGNMANMLAGDWVVLMATVQGSLATLPNACQIRVVPDAASTTSVEWINGNSTTLYSGGIWNFAGMTHIGLTVAGVGRCTGLGVYAPSLEVLTAGANLTLPIGSAGFHGIALRSN